MVSGETEAMVFGGGVGEVRCSPRRRSRDEGRACGACGLWQVQLFLPRLEPMMASGREWEMRLQKGRLRGRRLKEAEH